MKLDPKTAERMKRAAIERQAQKDIDAQKRPSKRDPGYSKGQRRKLAKIGLSGKVSQPESVVKALDQVPDAQTGRIVDVRQQDATAKGERSTRAAMVQQVHPAIGMLTDYAQEGWLGYAEMYDAAQPCVVMGYEDRYADRRVSASQEEKDPAWLRARAKLTDFEATLDRKVKFHAEDFMRKKESLKITPIVLVMLEGVGKKLAKALESR